MIRYIPHNEIDFKKYDACIRNSPSTLIYAESWFLNIENQNNWGILMYDDYQYVMPITYFRLKRSFWKKTLIQPFHCQQLGIISIKECSREIHYAFIKKLWELEPTGYNFNHSQNKYLKELDLIQKNNFILSLNDSYDSLFGQFSTTRRRWIRKSKKNDLQITLDNDASRFLDYQKRHLALNESIFVIQKRKRLLTTALEKNIVRIYSVLYNKQCVAMACFGFYRNRIYYMQSATNSQGKKLHAMDFLMDYIIRENSNKSLILDFEGSQIEGVAKYMQSFGAENEPFYVYRK